MIIFLAPNQKLSSLIFTFFFSFPHLVNYHLLGALPPKSLPGLAATVWFHSSRVSPGLWWGEADIIISGSQMRDIYSLYSPKMYFLGLQTFSLLSWVSLGLSLSLLIIWNLHQVMSFHMVNKAGCLPLEQGWCGGGGRKTKHSFFFFWLFLNFLKYLKIYIIVPLI